MSFFKKHTPFVSIFFLLFSFSTSLFAIDVATYDQLLKAIRDVRQAASQRIELAANQEKIREAWETGKLIDEHILHHQEHAAYGKEVFKHLAKDLDSNVWDLRYMRRFAVTYPESPKPQHLTWWHYEALLSLDDQTQREALAELAEKENWSGVRLRTEIRNRNLGVTSEEPQTKLPEVKPGKIGVYKIVRAKAGPYQGDLVLDLGFSNYFKLGNMKEFQEGDLVYVKPVKQSKKGLAASFQFEKVLPLKSREEIHLSTQKNPIYGDDSMLFTYNASLMPAGVFDGDTFHAMIDLGFGVTLEQRLRLRRLDAPEIDYSEGRDAKAVLEKILSRAKGPLVIKVAKSDDQYGRYLADVWVDGENINQELLDSGFFTARGQD